MIATNMDMQPANEASDIAMVILEMYIIAYIIHATLRAVKHNCQLKVLNKVSSLFEYKFSIFSFVNTHHHISKKT